MKLFWKQFNGMVCLLIVSFTVFGSLLLYSSFQMNLEREQERGLEELKMYQYAMLASLQSLPENYQAVDQAAAKIAESIGSSMGNSQNTVAVYNERQTVIYQDGAHESVLAPEDMADTLAENNGVFWLSVREDRHYLVCLSSLRSGAGNYYLEINRDIEFVYQNREELYRKYIITIIIAMLFSILMSLLFSLGFTAPIRRLSAATRAFSNGDYQSRVSVKGEDEISMLMEDFNKMAEQLERNIWELSDTARRQEEFTGAFAHELKTPLTSIIGYAQMLRSMELSEAERQISADYIYRQGKRLERLSYKMLELARVEQQELVFQRIDAVVLGSSVEELVREPLRKKQIKLHKRIDAGAVYGDPDLLLSLFGNLIDNARKACDAGGTIWFLGKKTAAGYEFFVRDNGRGMEEEEIGRITEAFYMIDKSRARKEGGAGLGMALCSKIVKLHHAGWSIKSRIGKGTLVGILFPEREELEEDAEGQDERENREKDG